MNFGKVRDFPAILKTLEGKILEYGMGSVSEEEQSLDFRGEFVPLFKMGTQLEIVRVQDKIETQRFIGEVYLSSQKMLRLISVTDEVLPGAATAYQYNVDIQGQATALIPPSPEKHAKRFSLLHRHTESLPSVQRFPITIHAISMSKIKFISDKTLPQGQRINISTNQPFRLDSVPAEVEVPIVCGPMETCSYRCRILELSGNNYLELEAFTRKISLQENKLFPPVAISNEEEHP